jgi:hypothetical protein
MNRHERYVAQLRQLDIAVPALSSARLPTELEIADKSFELPSIDLALSYFPNRLMPEILGACLYDAIHGVPQLVVAAIEQVEATGVAVGAELFAAEPEQQRIQRDVSLAINHFLHSQKGIVRDLTMLVDRIYQSAVNRAQLRCQWADSIASLISDGYLGPAEKMARMLEKKAKYASGYHGRVRLGKCPFDESLATDPRAFLADLACSRYIVPGDPARSPLLTTLVEPEGKMFRIFQPDELALIDEWVRDLPLIPVESSEHAATFRATEQDSPIPNDHAQEGKASRGATSDKGTKSRPPSIREMYYRLLNSEQDFEINVLALSFVQRWLRLSERQHAIGKRPLPFSTYSHHSLASWFDEMVSKQAASYKKREPGAFRNREHVVSDAVQLCPLVMIDGAWLQAWCGPELADNPIGRILYTIYSDEIGNGDTSLNHPNIYRSLMIEMGIDLPDVSSREFSEWSGFRDDAFRVPVFWLALSRFPRQFLPETLGLNLSMELSGVGGAYRSARDELRHHGFSSHFVDLHNTIDNVSSGHSAMALEAIQLYMDSIIGTLDRSDVDRHWQRVWTGYLSLVPPSRSLFSLLYRSSNYQKLVH